MGRVIELNGGAFARKGETGPVYGHQHDNLDYGPHQMAAAIQAGLLATKAIGEVSAPIIGGASRLAERDPREEKLKLLREQGQHEAAARVEEDIKLNPHPVEPKAPEPPPPPVDGRRGMAPASDYGRKPEESSVPTPVTDQSIANQPYDTPHATERARQALETGAQLAERKAAYEAADQNPNMPGQLAPREVAARQALGFPYRYDPAEARGNYNYAVDRDRAALTVEQQAAEARARARMPAPTPLPPPVQVQPEATKPEAVKPSTPTPPAQANALDPVFAQAPKPTVLADWKVQREEAVAKAKAGQPLSQDELSAATGVYTHQQLKAMMAEARVTGDHDAMREVLRLSRESNGLGVHPESYTDLMTGAHHDRALEELVKMGGEPKAVHTQTPLEQQLMYERIKDLQADNPTRATRMAAQAAKAQQDATIAAERAKNAPELEKGRANKETAEATTAGEVALNAPTVQANKALISTSEVGIKAAEAAAAPNFYEARARELKSKAMTAAAEARNSSQYYEGRATVEGAKGRNADKLESARTAKMVNEAKISETELKWRDQLLQARIAWLKNGDSRQIVNLLAGIMGPQVAKLQALKDAEDGKKAEGEAPVNQDQSRGPRLKSEQDREAAKAEGVRLEAERKAHEKSMRANGVEIDKDGNVDFEGTVKKWLNPKPQAGDIKIP